MSEKKTSLLVPRLTLLAVTATCIVSAYNLGHMNGKNVGQAQERLAIARENLSALTMADRAAAALQTKIDQLAGQAALSETARQVAARENRNASQAILARPLYRTVCVDADGVRLLDQAADIANGNSASEGLARSADAAGATAEAPAH